MKLIKYNKGIKPSTNNGGNTGGGSISNGGTLNRTIWGQHDEGDDVDGSMVVNGNVDIKAIIPPTYDNEEDSDGDDEEIETGGGNLNVELKITSDETESNEVYAKNHLWINYPHPTGTKQCVVDLIKNNSDKIAANTTNITNLTTTVNNHTTQINNLNTTVNNHTTQINNHTTQITNNTTNISYNADEIAAIKKRLDELENTDNSTDNSVDLSAIEKQLKELKYGTYFHPVIVLSGSIAKTSYANASYKYSFSGSQSDLIEKVEVSYEGGLMTVNIKPITMDNVEATVELTSVAVMQELSGDTANNSTSFKSGHSTEVSIGGRSDGWHGFESWIENDKTIKIREFHQKNNDNDSWGTDNWAGDGGGIRKIKIIATGYSSHVNLYS